MDVSELLYDTALGGGQALEVRRKMMVREKGMLRLQYVNTFKITGNVQPAGPDVLEQLKQEDRGNGITVFRTPFTLQHGADTKQGALQPDEIIYGGHTYRVLRVEDWPMHNLCIGYAVREEGDAHDA